ncbi:MAG TPA: exodeoxyribonuclease VII small subunit [Gemmataceae bacterium]|nr:exodeoxyribonuclease VII small subunit [Gemmataceae bacterium]
MTDTPTFEAALAELEQILRCLEDGTIALEESLARYERGVALLKHCYAQLQSAEQRISLLAGLDAEGKPALQTFEHASSADASPSDSSRRAARAKPRDGSGSY